MREKPKPTTNPPSHRPPGASPIPRIDMVGLRAFQPLVEASAEYDHVVMKGGYLTRPDDLLSWRTCRTIKVRPANWFERLFRITDEFKISSAKNRAFRVAQRQAKRDESRYRRTHEWLAQVRESVKR